MGRGLLVSSRLNTERGGRRDRRYDILILVPQSSKLIQEIIIGLSREEKDAIRAFFLAKGLPTDHAVTFSDVTLPEHYSDIRSRSEICDFGTHLVPSFPILIPIVSANMESVTGLELGVAIEREGGLAFPPQTLPIEERLKLIERIGRTDSALIDKPLTISPDHHTLKDAKELMGRFGIRSVIAIDEGRRPIGILTTRDWLYGKDEGVLIKDLMTKKLITAPRGIHFDDAAKILRKNKIEKLPLVDKNGKLAGLITANGLFYQSRHPRATRDDKGRFLRAGSIGVGQVFTPRHMKEVEAQVKNDIRMLLIDTARAYSVNTEEAITKIKKAFPELPLVVGNVSTADGAKFLFESGADVVKVGQGPGFVCRTRAVGVGVPQLTAIAECAVIAERYGKTVIADGGVKSPGDLAKALTVGARAVMMGNLLVRARESASPIFVDEENRPVKNYVGSASFAAQLARQKRGDLAYLRRPEGVTQVVPVTGTVHEIVDDLLRGLSSAMAYLGAKNLEELRRKGKFLPQTAAGHVEGVKKI
jgi:IMP dehydrogenase